MLPQGEWRNGILYGKDLSRAGLRVGNDLASMAVEGGGGSGSEEDEEEEDEAGSSTSLQGGGKKIDTSQVIGGRCR